MKKFYFYLLLIFTLHQNIYAQNDTISTKLQEIVVRENRIELPFKAQSRSVQILTNRQLQFMPVQSVTDALQSVPGIDIRQRGASGMQADLHIRGGGFDQALVLLNGVRLSDPQTGHHLLNLPVDFQAIRQIEVLKGPGARIFGQNAFSGAINIVTEAPAKRIVTSGLMIGDFKQDQFQAYASLPIGRFRQHIAATLTESDGYRHNTDFKFANIFYQAQWKALGGQWDFLINHNQRAFGANGFYGNLSFTEQYEEVQTDAASLGYRFQSGNFTLKPRVYWRRNQDMYVFLREKPDVFRNFHLSQFVGGEINSTLKSAWGTTGLGFSFDRTDLFSNRLGERFREAANVFVEHRFEWMNGRLDLTPGIAGSQFSDFGGFVFPGLDAGFQLNDTWKIFANTGLTSRIPTYTDLYYEDAGNKGNPNLKPERAFANELGAKWFKKGINAQIALFSRNSTDGIDWTRSSEAEKWTTQNFNQIKMQGIDASFEVDFTAKYNETVRFRRFTAGYTFIDAQVSDQVAFSKYTLNHLRHQLVTSVEHRIFRGIVHSARVRWCDRPTNTSTVKGDYWVADSRISWKYRHWKVYAEATNVFNTVYGEIRYSDTAILTMPGRWFRAGFTVQIL